MILGAILGAAYGSSRIPAHLKKGLKHYKSLSSEITAFVAAVLPAQEKKQNDEMPKKVGSAAARPKKKKKKEAEPCEKAEAEASINADSVSAEERVEEKARWEQETTELKGAGKAEMAIGAVEAKAKVVAEAEKARAKLEEARILASMEAAEAKARAVAEAEAEAQAQTEAEQEARAKARGTQIAKQDAKQITEPCAMGHAGKTVHDHSACSESPPTNLLFTLLGLDSLACCRLPTSTQDSIGEIPPTAMGA